MRTYYQVQWLQSGGLEFEEYDNRREAEDRSDQIPGSWVISVRDDDYGWSMIRANLGGEK